MEIRKIVRTYSVDKSCDECKVGFMRATNLALLTYPPKYPHQCNKCGHEETYHKTYPFIEYGE